MPISSSIRCGAQLLSRPTGTNLLGLVKHLSIIDCYRRAQAHADATIDALALASPGRVSWWTTIPGVVLFNILVHVLTDTNRHAGHADRE
jgi:Protein of unknown function (DUF664)